MKTLRIAGLALVASTLVGCGSSAREESWEAIPTELKDCKFFRLRDGMSSVRVVRCPNSATTVTYSQGKSTANAVVIDGVEYVRKQ